MCLYHFFFSVCVTFVKPTWGTNLQGQFNSVASRRNLGRMFAAGNLVYFPQYHQILIDLYCFPHFLPFLFSCIDVLFNRTQGSSLFTWEISQKTTIFFCSSSFLGTFFWAPMFEHYHFYSWCDPVWCFTIFDQGFKFNKRFNIYQSNWDWVPYC